MIISAIKILLPTILAFLVGIVITPRLTTFMYTKKLWKKNSRDLAQGITNGDFTKIHNATDEISTPRVGGIIIWMSVILSILLVWLISKIFPSDLAAKLDFYSRSQTLIPLAALIIGAGIGLFDDLIQTGNIIGRLANDSIIYRYLKIASVIGVGLLIASWFYFKLGMTSIAIPFGTSLYLGWFFIPFFVIVMLAVFSTSIIDGLDGLAGGVLAIIFSAYAVIAFGQNQIDISAFCGVIAGGILAFLWFNIPPARFYMGETGILGLMVVLTVIAFLTDTVLVLPLIALPLTVTTASAIIQIVSYKYFGKRRVFKIAPLHHHFRALGWPREKVVMRYWVVSTITAILGVIIVFTSK
jgi:phospho-N-acetylmuramoyl-pentapeptide-transferase